MSEAKPDLQPLEFQGDKSYSQPAQSPDPKPLRDELLAKARIFLASPQVQHQDENARRSFLREKGLTEDEIENLLCNLPPKLPQIPPRTYPLPPPSNLPVLFLNVARLFSWFVGSSAILLFIYHRLFLARIARTSFARQSLKSHHLSLLRRLTTSLAALKESQAESFSVLPRLDRWKEPKPYSECRSVKDILNIVVQEKFDYAHIPPITLLRCGILDFGQGKEGDEANPTTSELFEYLEEEIPWLTTNDGQLLEETLWDALVAVPLFSRNSPPTSLDMPAKTTRWQYIPPTPTTDPPILRSMDALQRALRKDSVDRRTCSQLTLQSLSDLTGYISTQVYLPFRTVGIPLAHPTDSVENEVRREIKALKGLALNRRSFMASIPKASSGLGFSRTIT